MTGHWARVHTKEYDQGWEAAKSGKKFNTNPYPDRTHEYLN